MSRAALDVDLLVLGGGFSGSLLALVASRLGLSVALIEKAKHPRFALGESSTPVADLVLAGLARRYDLPRLLPLSKYGTWKSERPEIGCGPKRGFSYLKHEVGATFRPRADRANELLVAANPDLERADTHWLRADVDAFLFGEAKEAGVHAFEETMAATIEGESPWTVEAFSGSKAVRLRAAAIVDASGEGRVLARLFGIADEGASMRTHSRLLYSHFRGVAPFGEVYAEAGGDPRPHPFPIDDAALHHVFDGGWMYVLRFDDGRTSAGFSLDPQIHPEVSGLSPAEEWARQLGRFPSIARQFEGAAAILPIRRTERLQRRMAVAAGPGWAALPACAGIIDALYSTGNAHTLVGIERLATILDSTGPGAERDRRFAAYGKTVLDEIAFIDRLVAASWSNFRRFDRFTSVSMLYFAASIASEHRRMQGTFESSDGFLMAGHPSFRGRIDRALDDLLALGTLPPEAAFERWKDSVAAAVRQDDIAGLCDPAKLNLYPYEMKGA